MQPSLKEWGSWLISMRAEYSQNDLEFFCMEIHITSPINSFIQAFIDFSRDSWVCHTLGCDKNTKLFCCSNYFSFGYWKLTHLDSISLCHHCIFFFNLVSPYFVAWQHDSGLSCICSAPVQRSTISSKTPGSIYWRMVLITQIGALGVLTATGMSLPLTPLSLQNNCIYTHIHKYVYIYLPVTLLSRTWVHINMSDSKLLPH